MNPFEEKLQQASKLDDLIQALRIESQSVDIGVIKLDQMGGRYRAETLVSKGAFISSFSPIDLDLLRSFEQIPELLMENMVLGGRSWTIYRIFNRGEGFEFLVLDGHKLSDEVFNRFAHEWRWFKRLERAEDQLLKDELTGLYNTRYLDMVMDQELLRCQRFNVPFSVVFIDLDNFKSVNDRFGHLVGSDLLKAVSKALALAVRESDSLVRYGGDEFVGLLLGTNQMKASLVAERIRSSVENTYLNVAHQKVSVTASIGIASFPENGSTRDALLAAADRSMYIGKSQGKNCVIRPVIEPFRGRTHG